MTEPTKATAKDTSEEDGKNTKGKAEGADTDAAKDQDAPKFTQKDQDLLAAKIRREEKEKFDRKQAEEKRVREEAEAKEQGKFEKLAADRQSRIEQLETDLATVKTQLGSYESKVAELVALELKALPEKVRDLGPTQYNEDKTVSNPLDVLAWLPKAKTFAGESGTDKASPGHGADPKPKGQNGKEAYEASHAKMIGSGKYAGF